MPLIDRKILAVLGLWILISPWVLGFSDISLLKWSNVLVGTAVFLINFWKIYDDNSGQPEKSL